jgi:hypothetical protein
VSDRPERMLHIDFRWLKDPDDTVAVPELTAPRSGRVSRRVSGRIPLFYVRG